MLVSLTVGKVDAGMAVLLTEDKRIIEFPSILLPADISSGSIVDITVSRNLTSEATAQKAFNQQQNNIFQTFGVQTPSTPILRCRNATQTSVVLEWDPVELATSELRSLSLYRNGSKAGAIPNPKDMTCTKISGLAVDTEYTFHLVLRTSAGTFASEKLVIRTHKMTDLSGITVSAGVMPAALRESLIGTVNKIGAKIVEGVRIDTTHFVCTEGRGQAWERAVEMNIPVVVPDWVKGCEREGRLVGVRGYYLNADPRLRQVGPSVVQTGQTSPDANHPMRSPPPTTHVTPPTPERSTKDRREDVMKEGRTSEEPPTPPPKMDSPSNETIGSSTLVDRTAAGKEFGPPIEEEDSEDEEELPRNEESEELGGRDKGKKVSVEDQKDEDGSFDDVAL